MLKYVFSQSIRQMHSTATLTYMYMCAEWTPKNAAVTRTRTRTQKTLRLEGKPKIESVKSVDLIWIYFYHIFEIGQLS